MNNKGQLNKTESPVMDDSFMKEGMQPIIGQVISDQEKITKPFGTENKIPFARYFNTKNKRKALLFLVAPIFLLIFFEIINRQSSVPLFFFFYSFVFPFFIISFIYGLILFFKKEESTVVSSLKDNDRRQAKRNRISIALALVQVIGVILMVLLMLSVAGTTGGEFIALFSFMTIVPFLLGVSIFNLFYLPITIKKNKPKRKILILFVISIFISLAIFIYGGLIVVNTALGFIRFGNNMTQSRKEDRLKRENTIAENKNPEITKNEAINLLNSCKVGVFSYTKQDKSYDYDGYSIPPPGKTASGIVIARYEGKIMTMRIADSNIAEIVPIARNAQVSCGKPQFWHDGNYEQYKDGKWYFKDEVVNDVYAGKSQDFAIKYMKDCKADIVIGTTGDLSILVPNTKQWMEKAEKNTSGIEIQEGIPKNFVFLSKAKTTEFQDLLRQIRQECYSKRMLYIITDDYVEVEYPKGTWTKQPVR